MRLHDADDTIVAISTPVGEGGIGIVRLSGRDALRIADEMFAAKDGTKPSAHKTHTLCYGHVVDGGQGSGVRGQGYVNPLSDPGSRNPVPEIVDEAILTVMRAPRTYTKEDIVEINCHGGIQALKKTLELAIKNGARVAEPGEFTKRAFLNGRIDLAQAEGVLDTIRAKTEGSLKVAVSQLSGELSGKVNGIREDLIDIAAQVEALIDFPDEEIGIVDAELIKKADGATARLKDLIATFDHGAILREGILAVICGKPNVGKSSLMNLLLKRDRVIVTPIPGTTRDAVEETINLRGIPIRLVDTAGIVETSDIVEKEGVKRSKNYVQLADIAFLMFDSSSAIEDKDLEVIELVKDKKKIVILNKNDLAKKIDTKRLNELCPASRFVEVSVEKKKNIEEMERVIVEAVWGGGFYQGEGAVVANARHKELLDKAFANMLSVTKALKGEVAPELVAIDLKEAIFSLGLIVGKSVSDDILERIFSQFCIGK